MFGTPAKAVGVTVEVTDSAEALLDSRLARRLITLELADVELPTVPRSSNQGGAVEKSLRASEVVFVRLLADADVLTVELWAQGLVAGERRIRVVGTEEHQARRVALACAELARRVREARLSERQRLLREHLFPSVVEDSASYSVAVNLGGAINTRAVWLPTFESTLVGPRVAMWVQSKQGLSLELAFAYYHSATLQGLRFWSELGVRPGWGFVLGRDVNGSIGASAFAALLDVGSKSSILGASESQQTWSARVALDGRISYQLASRASLTIGPEVGLLLRDIGVTSRANGVEHIRGLWLGLGLGAEWLL